MRAELLDLIDIPEEGASILLLTTDEWEGRVLPIRIDPSASFSIRKAMGVVDFQRPLTHDLMVELMNRFDITMEKVTIDAMINGVYLATIFVRDNRTNESIQLDARPSDATALALRVGAPIYVAEHLVAYTESLESYMNLRSSFEKSA